MQSEKPLSFCLSIRVLQCWQFVQIYNLFEVVIVHCAVCIVHFALCIVHCALCIVQCAQLLAYCRVCDDLQKLGEGVIRLSRHTEQLWIHNDVHHLPLSPWHNCMHPGQLSECVRGGCGLCVGCVGWEWFERTRGHLSCLAWQEKLQVTLWGVGWAGERKGNRQGCR